MTSSLGYSVCAFPSGLPLTTSKSKVTAKEDGLLRTLCVLTAVLSGCTVSGLVWVWRGKEDNANTILEEARLEQ